MNLWMPADLTPLYVSSIGTGLAVNDAVSNLGLLWRGGVLFKISGIKLQKDILYGWFTHSMHQLSC